MRLAEETMHDGLKRSLSLGSVQDSHPNNTTYAGYQIHGFQMLPQMRPAEIE